MVTKIANLLDFLKSQLMRTDPNELGDLKKSKVLIHCYKIRQNPAGREVNSKIPGRSPSFLPRAKAAQG